MSQRRDPEKARFYINALDVARSHDNWHEVPELVRKVAKHAPLRKCLVLAASSECQVATSNARPSTASSVQSAGPSDLISPLRLMLRTEIPFYQDGLQAKVCLGWIHWSISQPDLALKALPEDFGVVLQELARNAREPYGWTEICVIKGAYLKASVQEQVVGKAEALGTFKSVMSWLLERASKPATSPQQLFWEEQFLARAATLASREMTSGSRENISFALSAFRLWGKLESIKHDFQTIAADPYAGPVLSSSQVWKTYFDFLSRILQQGLPYPPSASLQKSDAKTKIPPRAQQVIELRRCEAVCESNFLRGMRFPKASGSNRQVENWVDQVIRNWKILCGPDWYEEELGDGGRNAIGRNVLDVLYRAASKTFHSTLILRRLFQVHASLTDFDLAFNALDSYIDIVTRGKARTEGSEELQTELDDDETFLHTIGEGILVLCQYGSLKEAEKARDLCDLLEAELKKRPDPSNETLVNGDAMSNSLHEPKEPLFSNASFASVYRYIGIGLATWARWTPINEARSKIQAKAIDYLRKSLALKGGEYADLGASFALGLLLAETRDINGAVETIKEALSSNTPVSPPSKTPHLNLVRRSYEKERHLIPLWHLLSLLLSGRQDFDTAVRSCEAAFEQFPSPSILFGQGKPFAAKPSNRENEKSALTPFHARPEQLRGVVDDMEYVESERILEIRMTELALTEVLEGPEVAVNSSNELLSLFVRLFGNLGIDMEENPKKEAVPAPPKSSSGTLKSFKGSLFGRKKTPRGTVLRGVETNNTPIAESATSKTTPFAGADSTEAPGIQVTGEGLSEKYSATERQSHRAPTRNSANQHKLLKREGSLAKRIRRQSEERKSRSTSRPRSSYQPSSRRQSFEANGEVPNQNAYHRRSNTYHGSSSALSPDEVGVAVTADIPSPSASPTTANHDDPPKAKPPHSLIAHNIDPNKEPPAPGHSKQSLQQDTRFPAVNPNSTSIQPQPRFPKTQAQKQALGILVKVWLLISGLYRRASMYEDAREACDEASKHASRVESLAAAQGSSARAFAARGWGGGQSSDELWADIFAERGYLALSEASPHTALDLFEKAVLYLPDHLKATIGLSNILLDISDQTIPPEPPRPTLSAGLSSLSLSPHAPISKPKPAATAITTTTTSSTTTANTKPLPHLPPSNPASKPQLAHSASTNLDSPTPSPNDAFQRKTPASLNRIAARDRAYGLLSTLTKLDRGWDSSEAWFALARAYEAGGEINRAKDCLWWVVELEDRRPVRHWRRVGGGYVL